MEDNTIILQETFNRVDFNNPRSITQYGSDLLREMGNFTRSIASMASPNKINNLELEKRLNKINHLSNYLESSEDVTLNPKLLSLVKDNLKEKVINPVKNKLFGIEDYTESFADLYAKINEEIDAVEQTVEERKMSVLENMTIDTEYMEHMNLYIKKLEDLITIGEQDLEEFKDKIKLLEEKNKKNEDEIVKGEIKSGNQRISLFEKKLEILKEQLVMTQESIIQTKLKENVNMHIVMQYDEYNESTINVLRSQSTSMVTTKLQRDNLNQQKKLNEMTNNIILRNSKTIVENIEKANEMRVSGNISMDTLKDLTENVKKGIKLVQESDQMVEEARKKNAPILEKMIKNFSEYNESIATLVNDNIEEQGAFQKVNKR